MRRQWPEEQAKWPLCEFWGFCGGTLPMGHQRRQLVHEVREHEPGPLVKVGTHTVKHGNAESIAVLIGLHCSSGAQMQASETQNRAAESAGRRHERPSGA